MATGRRMGMLPESIARREIDKLIGLLKIYKDIKNRDVEGCVDQVCYAIQREAVKTEIKSIMAYLRKWNVKVKIRDENTNDRSS